MLALVYARWYIQPQPLFEADLYLTKKPVYPLSVLENDIWTNDLATVTRKTADFDDFFIHSNYTMFKLEIAGTKIYNPYIDVGGPLFFFPSHCYGKTKPYNSSLVAYVANDNQIERDMLEQLSQLFQTQRQMAKVFTSILTSNDTGTLPVELGKLIGIDQLLNVGLSPLPANLTQAILNLVYTSPQNVTTQNLTAILQTVGLSDLDIQRILQLQNGTTSERLQSIGLNESQMEFFDNLIAFQQNPDFQNLNKTGLLSNFEQNQILQIQDIFGVQVATNLINETGIFDQIGLTQNQTNWLSDLIENRTQTTSKAPLRFLQLNITDLVQSANDTLNSFEFTAADRDQTQELQISSSLSELLGLNETQIDQVNALYELASGRTNFTTLNSTGLLAPLQLTENQTQALIDVQSIQNIGAFNTLIEQFNTIQVEDFSLTNLYESGLLLDFGLTQNQTIVLLQLIQAQNGVAIEFKELNNSGVLTQFGLDSNQTKFVELAVQFQNNNTELIQNLFKNYSTDARDEFVQASLKYALDTQDGLSTLRRMLSLLNDTSIESLGNFTLQAFASKTEMDSYITDKDYGKVTPAICFGFSIHENSQSDYELELFFNDQNPNSLQSLPRQKPKAVDPTKQLPDMSSYSRYSLQGFVAMENWFANTILKRVTGKEDASVLTMVSPFRIDPYVNDSFSQVLQSTLVFFMLLMYIPALYRTVYRIVAEKASKTKESMRMMGMTDFPYWSSWFTYYTMVNTTLTVLSWLVLYRNVFKNSSGVLLFLMFFIFGQSIFGLILIAQSLFTTPRAAAITCTVVYFGSALVRIFVYDPDTPYLRKILICMFFPTVAMCETGATFAQFETQGPGLDFKTYSLYWNNFSVRDGLICMTFGGTLMFCFGLYLEQVMPKTFGQRKRPCFCFECKSTKRNNKVDKSMNEDDADFETKYLDKDSYEPMTREQLEKQSKNQIMRIQDLFKQYENGFKAVNGVNLKMFADQIFVLLGHNGAGKTTTISMLTGLFGPTSGQAEVFGTDIFTEMQEVRQIMGVCPQHDVLFELLTVEEHLQFFYDLKGANPDKKVKADEIEKLMKDIGVDDKRFGLAGQLSGGNKRKLSVAIALCGGSKFILLDEPTSGMDLSARRQLWNMLKFYKRGRIVILTTHYMDEADILGDRIGIMASGQMTCLGSSIFLKSKFGEGYNLTLVKDSTEPNTLLLPYLQKHLGPEVKKQSEVQVEMKVTVPNEYASQFAEFFSKFDADLESLGIRSYGMSMSTLEEVFMKKGHFPKPDDESLLELSNKPPSSLTNQVPGQTNQTPDLLSAQDPSELNSNEKLKASRPWSGPATHDHPDIELSQRLTMVGFGTKNQIELDFQNDSKSENNRKSRLLLSDNKLASDGNRPSNLLFQDTSKLYEIKPQSFDLPEDLESNKQEVVREFNMKDNVNDLDESFSTNLKAVMYKRFNNYRRNKKAIFNEVILPSIIMVVGVSLARLTYPVRSPSRFFDTSLLPLPQKLVINPEPVIDCDISPKELAAGLGNSSVFNVTFSDPENKTFNDFGMEVFKLGQKQVKPPYMYGSYQIYEADRQKQAYKFVSFVNTTSQDATGLYPQFMYESILKTATNNSDFSYKLRSTPYPLAELIKVRFIVADASSVVFMTSIAFSMIITAVVSYLVVERVNGLKHLQIISGMQLKAYWIGNFIFDALKIEVTILCVIGLFFGYDMKYDAAWITFLLIPFAVMPYTYVVSFIFTTDSAAQTFTMFGHFMTITLISTIVVALRLNFDTEAVGDFLNWCFRLIPTYNLASSVYFDAAGEILVQVRKSTITKGNHTGEPIDPSLWNINNNSGDMLFVGMHLLFWSVVLGFMEKGYFKMLDAFMRRFKKEIPVTDIILDQDVIDEELRVKEGLKSDIVVKNLRKIYSQKSKKCGQSTDMVAVSNLSFALNAGECFALLGVNGAGKSTTFKSLTCEVQPTSGQIEIGGYNVHQDFEKARKLIGYCPQPNLVFPDMSVEEHITYYATMKGIPSCKRKEIIEQTISELGLQEQRTKAAGTLSGGNQRKLCVAQALIGSPPIVFLDEPSAGMDPEARRFMWSVVAKIAQRKTSAVVLTTHSMEEAEALSTKMGIMVKGGIFKCFGSSQHIKNKFGTGFAIEIKVKTVLEEELPFVEQKYFVDGELSISDDLNLSSGVTDMVNQEAAKCFDHVGKLRYVFNLINQLACISELCQYFGTVELIERFDNYIKIRMERQDKTIGSVFGLVEQLKLRYAVGEYSVSQTTLEQIFQAFANVQFDENVQTFKLQEGKLVKME